MRYVVYGVGAIGGVIAARLALSDVDTAGIARGAQLEALQTQGLKLRTPADDTRIRFPVAADPSALGIRKDDIIILAVKSQDTVGALEALRSAGVTNQPIICAQNGVANERMALRVFPNVYAMMVVMPATFVVPGEVVAFGTPKAGIFDLGRYPSGSDALVISACAMFDTAGFAAFPSERVMESKYAKLILNLGNVVDAATGDDTGAKELLDRVRAEGRAVLSAAGIKFGDVGPNDDRRKRLMQLQPIPGADRVGSSSAQSLMRGTGSIETDYLNGEIVLLGRLNGAPVPLNARLMALGEKLIAEKRRPGSMSLDELNRFIEQK